MRNAHQWLIIILLAVVIHQGMGYRGEIDRLSQNFHSQLHSIRQELSSLKHALYQAQEEAAWYSRPQIEFTGSDEQNREAYLSITWTFRQLAPDAKLNLAYQVADGAWQEVEVERVMGLTYRAFITVPVVNETMPYMTQYGSASGREHRVQAEQKGQSDATIQYSITATDAEQTLGGKVEALDLAMVTGVFNFSVDEDSSKEQFRINLQRRFYQSEPQWDNVLAIEVLALNESLNELARLTLDEGGMHEWYGILETQTDQVRTLVAAVTFQDGTVADLSLRLP